MKKLLLFLLLLSVTEIGTSLLAQDANSTDLTKEELLRRFLYQNNLMPQERVHVMTDRNHYLSGDTIWMRAFLVDGLYKKPVHYSRFLYVELRDENDALACRVKLHEQPEKGDSVMRGYLPTPPELPTGVYTLVAYTQWMLNGGEKQFFKRNVQLLNVGDMGKNLITDPLTVTTGCDAYHSIDSTALLKADEAVIVVHPVLKTEKITYGSREKVTVSFQVPPFSTLAAAVTDNAAGPADPRAALHYTILGQPYWHNLDSIYAGKYREPTYLNEISQEVRGHLRGTLRRQPKPNTLMMLFSPSARLFRTTRTDSLGNFCFEDFDAIDTVTFSVRAFSDRGRSKGEVLLTPSVLPEVVHHLEAPVKPVTRSAESSDSLQVNKLKQRIRFSNGQWEITLNEVGVSAKKATRGMDHASKYAEWKAGFKEIQEMNVVSLEDLLNNIPGVIIDVNEAGKRIAKYRGKELHFIMNGMEVALSVTEDETEFEYVDSYCNTDCIEFLDLIQATYASTSITDFNAYVIRIQENPTLATKVDLGSITFKPLGHQVPKEYHAIDYANPADRYANPPGTDMRSTLYWNPRIEVDSTGIASFSFWTNDNYNTIYTIRLEGVSESGQLIDALKRIKMQ
ncbi:MAG: hypothetical protein IJP70_07760 [Bacteroidales bacterium]|nr:hypothetical protein [Bacteroidales bacterium]